MNANEILTAVKAGESLDWEFKSAKGGFPASVWRDRGGGRPLQRPVRPSPSAGGRKRVEPRAQGCLYNGIQFAY